MKKWIAGIAMVLVLALCFGIAIDVRGSYREYTWEMLLQRSYGTALSLYPVDYSGEEPKEVVVDRFETVEEGSQVIAVARYTGEKAFTSGTIFHKFQVETTLKGECPEKVTVFIRHAAVNMRPEDTDQSDSYIMAMAGVLGFEKDARYLLCLNKVEYDPRLNLPEEKKNPYVPFQENALGIYKLTDERTQGTPETGSPVAQVIEQYQVQLKDIVQVSRYNALQDQAVAYARDHGVEVP